VASLPAAGVRPSLLLALSAVLAMPALALAGHAGGDAAFDPWFRNLMLLLGLVVSVSTLLRHWLPKPPAHERYAPLNHAHDEYLRRAELPEQREHIRAAFTLETNRQVAAMRETLSDQIAHLGHSLAADLSAFNDAAENRSEKLHRRIDPLVEQVAANHQAIRQHIDDERAVKAAAAHPHHPQPQHGGILNGN